MKKLARLFFNNILSLVTTFLLMAAPVAAIVYASEPIEVSNTYTLQSNALAQEDTMDDQLELLGEKINDWKPDILDDSIASTFMNIKQHKGDKKVH